MIEYQVLGYNRNDYITDIVNWELLKVFNDKESAESYAFCLTDYVCKVVEVDQELQSDIIDINKAVHWEIYTGL